MIHTALPTQYPPPPLPGKTFWRWTFSIILIHTLLFGVIAAVAVWGMFRWDPIPFTISWQVSFPGNVVILIFQFMPFLLCILVVFNILALYAIARLTRGRASRGIAHLYLVGSGLLVAIFATSVLTLALHGGSISSGATTITDSGGVMSGLAGVLLLAVPTLLVVIGRLRYFPAKYIPGQCPRCSYNLTGNTSGVCPECGRAIAHSQPGPVQSP
ncbi:MAG TPA: hypothetical protein VIM11_08265 [Tepidisphaeraceae bacterium]|jgi:hypothetical protein